MKCISPHRFRLGWQRLHCNIHTTSPAEVHEVGHSPVILRSAGGCTVASRRQGVSPMDQPDPLCLLRSRACAGCWKPHSPQRTLRTNEELRMNRRWPGGARRAQDQRVSRARKEDAGHRCRASGAAGVPWQLPAAPLSPSSLLRVGAKNTATTAQLVRNPLIRVVGSGCRREAVDQSSRENRRAPAG